VVLVLAVVVVVLVLVVVDPPGLGSTAVVGAGIAASAVGAGGNVALKKRNP
jgi:hypothetical protein